MLPLLPDDARVQRLYTEYLMKSITAEKEKVELQLKLRKVNWMKRYLCDSIVQSGKLSKIIKSEGRKVIVRIRNPSRTMKLVSGFVGATAIVFIIMVFLILS